MGSGNAGAQMDPEEDFVMIGFSFGTFQEERWLRDREFFMKRAGELGAAVNILFANNDAALQIMQAKQLIDQGISVLVAVPDDGEAFSEVVDYARQKGVKVIAYDRMIKNCDLDLYISFDNVRVGEMQTRGVLNVRKSGNFAYIGGAPSDNNAHLVKEGAFHLLQPEIDNGNIKIVLDKFSQDWSPSEAYQNVKEYLDKNGPLDAVVAANDGTAGGAIKALEEHGLAGRVPVSGQDADLAACQRIVQGTQTVTVYKQLKSLAVKAAELAVALARGTDVDVNAKVNNGKIDVPAYLIEPIMITKDNMAEIVEDGFHAHEEIYGE